MLAAAMAFTMAVSTFGYTVTTAAEAVNESEYVTITPEVDFDEDADAVIIDPEIPEEEIEITLPDLDDIFTFTPEIDFDEDGNAVVVHPTISEVAAPEGIVLLHPGAQVHRSIPQANFRIVMPEYLSYDENSFLIEFIRLDGDGNDIGIMNNGLFYITAESGESSGVGPDWNDLTVGQFAAPNANTFFLWNWIRGPITMTFTYRDNPDVTITAQTYRQSPPPAPVPQGTIRVNAPEYVDPESQFTSIPLHLLYIDGTVGRRIYLDEVTIHVETDTHSGHDVGHFPGTYDFFSRHLARFDFGPHSQGLITITATLIVDPTVTGTVQFYRGFPVNTIDIIATPADGMWSDEYNYFSFSAINISFWEIDGQIGNIVRAVSLDDMDITIALDGQPGVNVGAFESPNPDDPHIHTFALADEARGYITISASLRVTPDYREVIGTAYIYRGTPQGGGGNDNNQGGGNNNQGGGNGNNQGGGNNNQDDGNNNNQGSGNYYTGGGNDSGNDSSSTPSTPSAPTTTIRTPANEGEVSLSVRITENNAVLQLPTSTLNAIINNAEDGIVTLDFSALEDIETVAIPRTAMRRFANEGLGLEIVLPQGTITFSAEAVYEIGQAARHSRITVEIVAVEDALEVSIISGGRVISGLEGEITVIQPESE